MTTDNIPMPFTPAASLERIMDVFDPTLAVDPASEFYIPRRDHQIEKLGFDLKHSRTGLLHAFLCGHRGSGKTTELRRLCQDAAIKEKYETVFLTTQDFGSETVHLTHDALLVEIGLALTREEKRFFVSAGLRDDFEKWGQQVVKTFLHDEGVRAEVGAKAGYWLAYFKAQLSTRREWKTEEKQILEPKVQDLVGLLNAMAQEIKNQTGRRLLLVVDDLEKGESDAHKEMHKRLFQEHYDVLVQPRFSIVYTLPIYFRALPGSRIPSEQLYAFSAVHLYEREQKKEDRPALAKEHCGYQLMRDFVEKRLASRSALFSDEVLDELLLIGGGLFRETARAIRDAAYFAQLRGANSIEPADVDRVFDQIKKEYQPLIRGGAIGVLKAVFASEQGWVCDVEPYLQARAVVEYENGDLWLDLRHVLKPYVRGLKGEDG
jgi:hypothetical protein